METVAALLGSSDARDVATARLAALRAGVLLPGRGTGPELAGLLWHVREEERRLALDPDPEWWEAARALQGDDAAPYVPWEPSWTRR
ncbi:hypothetical protein H1Q78_18000 [Cellulosimicrobium cellulans]|uniref:hypothetical protein n=1 Tax=Cellulosimicrobium cellulans TaxID=1710 RepID=UPI001EDAC4C0|nr:hypothetical protein [Cellulosimicrobium cellulans]UKJ63508.1 hypothetical protein H1Q78_18000 [Cellulosimicrobium cellulans]